MAVDFSTNMGYVIEMFGVSATLKRKTQALSKYGDDSPTYVSETITLGVNGDSDEGEWNREGVFYPKGKLFFIKSSVTAPSEGDEIVYRGDTYEIKKISSPDSGFISHYECISQLI